MLDVADGVHSNKPSFVLFQRTSRGTEELRLSRRPRSSAMDVSERGLSLGLWRSTGFPPEQGWDPLKERTR